MTLSVPSRTQLRHKAIAAGLRPDGSLGQFFIHDTTAARRIARALGPHRHDGVLHAGPGLGALTVELLRKGTRVTAVEVDSLLARQLAVTVAEHTRGASARLTVLNRDVTTLRGPELLDEPTALVLSLPHQLTVEAMLHLLAEFPSIVSALALLETNVADRLTGRPVELAHQAAAVKAAFFGTLRDRGVISPAAFWPTPRHPYRLIQLQRHPASGHWSSDPSRRAHVFELVDIAYANPRRSARTAFSEWAGSGAQAARLLLAASIDPSRRANELQIADFVRLDQRALHPDLALRGHGR